MEWWNDFFQSEKLAWSGIPSEVESKEQTADPHDTELQTWLPRAGFGVSWQQPPDPEAATAAHSLLQEHDNMAVPDGLQIPPLCKWIGRKGVKGDIPNLKSNAFNPVLDVAIGDIVLVSVDKEASVLKRGWDITFVTNVYGELDQPSVNKFFDGVWLCPKSPKGVVDTLIWHTGWIKGKLEEMTQVKGRRNIIWDFEQYDLDFINWHTQPQATEVTGTLHPVNNKISSIKYKGMSRQHRN